MLQYSHDLGEPRSTALPESQRAGNATSIRQTLSVDPVVVQAWVPYHTPPQMSRLYRHVRARIDQTVALCRSLLARVEGRPLDQRDRYALADS